MTTAADIARLLSRARPLSTGGYTACCPAHDDTEPSLSLADGASGVVVKCHAGCTQDAVLDALAALGADLRKANGEDRVFDVVEFAATKRLKRQLLEQSYVRDVDLDDGRTAVAFEYRDRASKVTGIKIRRALSGKRGFFWRKGSRPSLYGLWRIDDMRTLDNRLVLVEGESDALTLWQHEFFALGLPGADSWREPWLAELPGGDPVYVVIEPDKGGEAVLKWLAKSELRHRARLVRMPPEHKDPSALYLADPEHFADRFEGLLSNAQPFVRDVSDSRDVPPRRPLDWAALKSRTPPTREWAINDWFGAGHVTLMSGAAGAGKTIVAQAIASCLALGREYLDHVPTARRVLMWATEDDHDELWRRQVAIAEWLGVSLADFRERLWLESYDAEQVELLAVSIDQRRIVSTPMYEELCQQIGDYRADAVILDNVARLYAGNENDRHQVTSFVALLARAAKPTRAAVLLLAHPGKAAGSEYSGSTAWEGAVRARLYLGRTLPDAEPTDIEAADDDSVRYLARRKANYSARDWRRLTYRDGVLVPEAREAGGTTASPLYARGVVERAVCKLTEMGEHGNAAPNSPRYLPRLAKQYGLLEHVHEREFAVAMRQMRKDGALVVATVGTYANRTPREGLVLASKD